jgi:alkylation response protein AidB-like acyl-CoA dehydrogenase
VPSIINMTFELSADEKALQARAAAVAAEHIVPRAASIDRDGVIPQSVRAAIEEARIAIERASAADLALVIEEWATASGAVAAVAGLALVSPNSDAVWGSGADATLPGLRGLGAIDATIAGLAPAGVTKARVVLAAVAVGIGRAALDEALSVMRAAGDRAGGTADERPHWVLADAATEVEAARLLTHKAGQAIDAGDGRAEASLAKVFAADVAERAVEAALRVLGPDGYRRGTVTERLTRDARAIQLLGGTSEEQRAIVADLTLPA